MSARIPYRGFQIVSSDVKGRKLARVLIGSSRSDASDFEAATLNDAIACARAWVDNFRAGELQARRGPYIGTVREYARFLLSQEVAPHNHNMLMAHARAPNRTMTATQLAAVVGWDSYASANAHYGTLGRQIAEYLELRPVEFGGEPIQTSTIASSADGNWSAQGREFKWRMHDELAEALLQVRQA